MHCRRSSRFNTSRPQQGAALIVAMLVFALAAALVVAMKSEFNRFFERTANILLAEQAQAYLRGAEDLAAMALIRDYDQDKQAGLARDDLTEEWAKPPPPFGLDGIGWMRGELEDLQGRFNLNALAERVRLADRRRRPVLPRRRNSLYACYRPWSDASVSEQEAIAITESISDWLDGDQTSPGWCGGELLLRPDAGVPHGEP